MIFKLCPFCGFVPNMEDGDTLHPNGVVWINTLYGRTYHLRSKTEYYDGECWAINCVEIAGGCGVSITADSREECVIKWEKRV